MRLLSACCLGGMILVLSGCAYTKVSVSESRRVGVVALIPEKVQTKYVGVWAFANKSDETDVPEANLQQSVTASTVAALKANGFDADAVTMRSSEWWAKYNAYRKSLGGYFGSNLIGDTERKSLRAELMAAASAQKLDTVVVVSPQKPSGGGETNVGVGDYGFGTVSRDREQVSTYMMTSLLVLDGRTLGTKTVRYVSDVRVVPGIPFKTEFREYSGEQQAILLKTMKEQFDTKVREAVGRMAAH